MEKEFTFMGKEMEKISIYYGAFLIFWGLLVSVLSQSSSITSFIPAFFWTSYFNIWLSNFNVS